ncbi:MAG: hypothetical protein WA691_03285 [Thermoplasmata archaeon]
MARGLWGIGAVGAALLLLGPALVGVGLAYDTAVTSSEVNCVGSCTGEAQSAENASFTFEVLLGLGILLGGIGLGLVLLVGIQYMVRWRP